jgi:CHAT domain-containing protein
VRVIFLLLVSSALAQQPQAANDYPTLRKDAADAYAKSQYNRALALYQAAADLSETTHNPVEIAKCYGDIGYVYYVQGKMTQALEAYHKGLEKLKPAHDLRVEGLLWRRTSLAYRWKGDLTEALASGQTALSLYQELGDPHESAGQLMNNGLVIRAQGDLRAGVATFEKAYELAEGLKDNVIMRSALRNLSASYWEQGDNEVALSFLERANAIKEPAEAARAIATTENIRGLILHSLKRYPEARSALERSLEQARIARDARLEVTVLSARSSTLRALNDLKGSVADLLKIEEMARPGELDRVRISTLGNLAERYVELNQPETALRYAQEGVALARQTNSVKLYWPLYGEGRAYTALGRVKEAKAAYEESIASLEKYGAQTAGGDTEGTRFFEMRGASYYGLLELRLRDANVDAALQLSERMKARRMGDVLAAGHASITQAMTAQEKDREQQLTREADRLNQQLTGASKPDPKVQKEFEAASRALDGFRAELYTAHPELQVHRSEAPPVGLADLRALLPDRRTLLVEFAEMDKAIAIFTVERGADGEPKLGLQRVKMDRDEFDKRVAAYRDSLAARDVGYRTEAQKLYQLLLAPIGAQLAGKTNVVIVPDGPLWNLPFHSLVDPEGHHAVERFAIDYAPSLTVLHAELRQRPLNGNLLAVGSPRGNLPNAAAEARELGRLYGAGSTVLTGSEATEARWREMAPRSGILHLATHGVLNNTNPLFSYLELAGGGVIEARSLLDLDLKASLAVLSACETGRGELLDGEGVIGLAWAMMVAGIPSVVVSEWKVDSGSTTQLMLAFHRELRSGQVKSKAAALRSAALALMKQPEYRHPFYWAGFQLLGNGQ